MAEIRHLENRHDVIFSAEGGPIWIKFGRFVQNDMSTVVIWSKPKPDVEFQYGELHGMSSQCHLPHCRVLPSDEFSVVIPQLCHIARCWHQANSTACHPRATYHIAVWCHLVNSLSWLQTAEPPCHIAECTGAITWRNQCHDCATLPGVIIPSAILKIVFRHILFFGFFNAVWALTSGAFRVVSDTLVNCAYDCVIVYIVIQATLSVTAMLKRLIVYVEGFVTTTGICQFLIVTDWSLNICCSAFSRFSLKSLERRLTSLLWLHFLDAPRSKTGRTDLHFIRACSHDLMWVALVSRYEYNAQLISQSVSHISVSFHQKWP